MFLETFHFIYLTFSSPSLQLSLHAIDFSVDSAYSDFSTDLPLPRSLPVVERTSEQTASGDS